MIEKRRHQVVFADDLTGALEIGALARQGDLLSRVFLNPDTFSNTTDVSVCDLGTRDLPNTVAAAVQRHATRACRDDEDTIILKKTDSLLRGNIAAEFAVLRQVYPHRPIVFVPAYPLMGRQVRQGTLYLRNESGEWVPRTRISDLFSNHFAPSDLRHVASLTELQSAVDRGNASLIVCDGVSQQEVDAMGAWLRQDPTRWILAGSGGVFRSYFLSSTHNLHDRVRNSCVEKPIPIGLGFVGSQHPVSRRQLEQLAASGRAWVHNFDGSSVSECQAFLEQALTADKWIFLHNSAERRPELHLHPFPPAVYLSGGATASMSLLRSGIHQLEPVCELMPGVVLSLAATPHSTMPVITKSGAFGDAYTMERIVRMLQGETIET